MIESDMIILKRLFILMDYVKKIYDKSDGFDSHVCVMSDKVCELKEKLSFKYRRRDEIPLRYLASKL
tara:strand:- start:192 stop:392 length:201 start_codon:yes stop_codon:yes gene_type:complete